MSLVKVKNFPSRMFAEQAREMLEREGIPAVIKSPDAGILGTTGSWVVQGADLYVPEEFAERAYELVTVIFDGW
ncbi:MAG: hypothetical protein ACOYU7_03225 [Bacillota bacterium]